MNGSAARQIRVLHVDDEPDLAAVVALHLERERESLEVVTEPDASAGLDRLAESSIDCIVSDHDMPGMDGLAFLEAVREEYPQLPFILYTGKGSEEIASEAISAGVTDYIQKEAGTDQYTVLANRIERAVDASRARGQLEETKRRRSTLISNLPGMVYRCRNEPDWPMEFVSDGCETLTGYEAAALEADEVTWGGDIVHPADREPTWEAVQNALDRDEQFEVTYRIETKAGETRWLWERGRGIDEGDQVVAIEGFITDITDRKDRERKLERYRRLVENVGDPMYALDDEGHIEMINDAMATHLGYDRDTIVGDHVSTYMTADSIERGDAVIADLLGSDREWANFEMTTIDADGEHTATENKLTTMTSDGEFVGSVGVIRDVSDRKEREAELQRYETIIQAVGDPVYTLDADGYFTFVNDAIETTAGHDPADLVGDHVSTVMADADVETARGLIRDLLDSDGRDNATFEMSLRTADDDHIPAENHMALLPFGSDGQFRGTAGVVRDITERKEREQRLEQFASVASHDLRNPLNVIIGRVEHVRRTTDNAHLDAIARAADRMERLIDDLLTLAQQGDTVGEMEPVSVAEIVDTAWRQTRTADASLDTEAGLGTLSADPHRLRELFENLFGNAVQHGPPEDEAPEGIDLTVRVGTVVTASDQGDDPAGIYVADDGTGIEVEDPDRLFEHGFSSDDEGTGLGLAIVQNIADAHGWEVSVSESWADGARFEITGFD